MSCREGCSQNVLNTFVLEPRYRMAAIERNYQLSFRISTFSAEEKKKKKGGGGGGGWKKI